MMNNIYLDIAIFVFLNIVLIYLFYTAYSINKNTAALNEEIEIYKELLEKIKEAEEYLETKNIKESEIN